MSIAAQQKVAMARDALGRAADALGVNAYDQVARKYAREQMRKAEAWIKEAREAMRVGAKKEEEPEPEPEEPDDGQADDENGDDDDPKEVDHDDQ